MAGLLTLMNVYTNDVEVEHNLGHYLESCRTHMSFDHVSATEQDVRQAVNSVNAKLRKKDTKVEGALLLDVIISQCGTDTFTSNCVFWTQQVMSLLQGDNRTHVAPTACRVLEKLLTYSSQFPEVARELSTSVVSNLVTLLCEPTLVEKQASITVPVLECLKSCMKSYNNSCGPVKPTIEQRILSFTDDDGVAADANLRMTWATCLSLLPSLGGAGAKGVQHRTNWIELCLHLLDSIRDTLSEMFRNIDEYKTQRVPVNPFKLPQLESQNPIALLHAYQRRFINLCAALSVLLKEPFPTHKNVPIDGILALISQVLSRNSKSLGKSNVANLEQLALVSIIPDLQSAVLDVLASLVAVCRSQLLTRGGIVMSSFVQVLQWTFTPLDVRRVATERPYGKLRSLVYRNLCLWVVSSRSACGLTKYVDVLFNQLLSDIAVQRDNVQLLTMNQPNGDTRTSRKGKRKSMDTCGVILKKEDFQANADVCQAALQCLTTILLCCGPRIKPAIHKEVQEITLSILIEIMNGADVKSLLPYNDHRCRAGLYRVLEKLVLCPNLQWPAPLNYATAIFNSGMNDPNLEVSSVCVEALASVQSILRPRGPTLNFAPEAKSVRSTLEETSLLNDSNSIQLLKSSLTLVHSSTAPQPAAMSIEQSMIVQKPTSVMDCHLTAPAQQPILAAQQPVEETSSAAVRVAEIRQPEASPMASECLNGNAHHHHDDFSTPPLGVTTIGTDSPDNPTRVMTRVEALKVIAAASSTQPLVVRDSPSRTQPSRIVEKNEPTPPKRPREDPKSLKSPKRSPNKILTELPFGTDDVDDSLESMLASFRDVPA